MPLGQSAEGLPIGMQSSGHISKTAHDSFFADLVEREFGVVAPAGYQRE